MFKRLFRSAMTNLTATVSTPAQVPRVPIPANGVDYRGKIVLAPMVRSGELPSRLLALHYGADLVWGPETIDRALIGAERRVNPRNGTVEFTRFPSNGGRAEKASKESVIYRIDPAREKGRLIFQLGSAEPELAIQAASVVAADVSGIDLNSGCPKPFSTHCGMGAALLKTPDKLVAILEALVNDVGKPFNIGISVKIRILSTAEETEALVSRLVRTGITGLTVHCRTTPMRPRERAIRDQLRMVADICHKAGVACVMNGDVTNRDEGLKLMEEFGVDGAMIATSAEANSSCFRTEAEGGLAEWEEVAREYIRFCLESENKFNNTKYLLNMLVPGKHKEFRKTENSRTYVDTCRCLGFEEFIPASIKLDERLGLADKWLNPVEEKPKAVQNAIENNESARAAGGETRPKTTSTPAHTGGPIRTSARPAPVKNEKPKAAESAAPEAPADIPPPAPEVVQKSQVTA